MSTDAAQALTKAPAAAEAGVDCKRPAAEAQGADVLGLRLGLPAAEAKRILRCQLPQALFETDKQWFEGLRTHGLELGPQVLRAISGRSVPCDLRTLQARRHCTAGGRVWEHQNELIQVATLGPPGEESVHGVWRAQHFEAGQMPALQDVETALVRKYGQPTLRIAAGSSHLDLAWVSEPDGTPLAAGSRQARQCREGTNAHPLGRQSFSEGCGQTIVASVAPAPKNSGLAERVSVGLTHQQHMYALGERMQQALDQRDAQRRQAELERAKTAAPAVKL